MSRGRYGTHRRCGVVDVHEVEPAVGVAGERHTGPQVVEPRQPPRAVEAGEPQGDAAGRRRVEQPFRFDEHVTGLAFRGRGCRLVDDAPGFVSPDAGGTGEDHAWVRPGSSDDGQQPAQSVHVDVAGRGCRTAVEADRPEDGRQRRQFREPAGVAGGHVPDEGLDAAGGKRGGAHVAPGDADDPRSFRQPAQGDAFAEVAAAHDEPHRSGGDVGADVTRAGRHASGPGAESAAPCCRASIHDASTTCAATASARSFLRPRVRPTPASSPAASRELYRSS